MSTTPAPRPEFRPSSAERSHELISNFVIYFANNFDRGGGTATLAGFCRDYDVSVQELEWTVGIIRRGIGNGRNAFSKFHLTNI